MIGCDNIANSVFDQLRQAQMQAADLDNQVYGLTKEGKVVTGKSGSRVSKNEADEMVSFFESLGVKVEKRQVRQIDVKRLLMNNAPEQSRGSENRLDMIEGDLAEVMHDGAEKGNQALVIAGGRLSTWPRLEGRALSSINSLLTVYHIDLAGLMKQHTPKSIDSVVAIDLPENLLRLKKLVIVPVDSGASSTEDLCRQYRKAGKALCEPEKGFADWHVVVLPPATSDRFIQEGCDGFSACAKEVAGLSSGQGVTIVCPPQSDVLSTLNAYGLASGTSLPKADPADGSGYQASGGVAETKGANQMDVVGFKGTTSFNARNDALIQHIAALQTGTRFTAFDLKQYLLDLMGLKKSTPGVDEAVDKVLTNMYDLLRRCKGGEKRLKGKLECYKAIFNQVQAWLLQEPRFDLDTQWEFHEQVKAVCPNILRLNDPADVERSGVNQANLNRLEKVRNDMQAKYHWVPDINAILLDRVGLSLLCDGDYAPTSDELKDILLGYIKAAILTKVPSSMVLDVRKRLQASVISQDSKDLILKIFNGWDNIEKARNNMRVYYEWLPSIDAVLPPVKALMNSHFSKQTDNARLVADVTGGCKKHVRDETYKRLPADFPSKLDKQTWQQMMANPSEEEIDMILRSAAPEN